MTRRTAWIGLVVALLVQLLLFRQFCLREIVPVFPRAFDQTSYLGLAYDLHETIRDRGLLHGLASVRHINAPQGILLEVEAGLAQFVEGPGRLAALDVNFAHLALFQVALVAVACWLGRPGLGLAVCGLLVSAISLYQGAGGIADFRLDFAALCLFGTLACVAIRSAFFRSVAWTMVFGVMAGVLLLTRTIYLAYLLPGLAAFVVLLLATRHFDGGRGRIRLLHLVGAGVVMGLMVLPSVLVRLQTITAYYVVGHRSEEATLRAREFGVSTSWEHVSYYARSAFVEHAGLTFVMLAIGVLFVSLLPARTARPAESSEPASERFSRADALIGLGWLAVTAMSAYLVLTSDISKSPVVGGVFIAMAVPAVLLVAVAFGPPAERMRWRVAVLLGVFLAGQAAYASHMVRRAAIPGDGPDMRELGRVMDTMARLSQEFGLSHPVISFDAVTEFTHAGVLKVLAYERLHIPLAPSSALAGISIGLPAISEADADTLLERSDFALLGRDRPLDGPELYPVNGALRKLGPHLYEKASREMVRVQDAAFFGRHVTLFMKPAVACTGSSGEWITDAGMECRTTGRVLAARPILRATGAGNFTWLPGVPTVSATIRQDDRQIGTVPCQLAASASAADPRPYVIECDTRGAAPRVAADEPVTLSLSFDRYFVPRQIGINDDTRHLVLVWPTAVEARTAP
jgi:hypothetical protein